MSSPALFAAFCVIIALLTAFLSLIRRVARAYDHRIAHRYKDAAQTISTEKPPKYRSGRLRPRFLQHCLRTVLYMIQFGLAFFVMEVMMYFNGWVFVSVVAGAGVGFFFFERDLRSGR